MRGPVLLAVLLFSVACFAQENPEKPLFDKSKARALPTPADAVVLAARDIKRVDLDQRGFQRYLFTYDKSKEHVGAVSYVLNNVLSHASVNYRPVVVGDGWLIRFDIRALWPRRADFDALSPEFEKLDEIDPYFHQIREIEVVEETKENKLVDTAPYQGKRADGTVGTLTQKWETTVKKTSRIKVVADHALHLLGEAGDAAPILELSGECASRTPILRADWFLATVSTTDPAHNGRYYQFRRISKSRDGKTAEQLWLEGLGVDYDTVKKVRSDQRLAKWRSKVTGKPRAIEFFYASSTRPEIGPSIVALTRDFFDGKVKGNKHVVKNLLEYEFDGTEAIGYLPNGGLSYALFDAKGELVDLAPPNLVSDFEIPDPFTKNLAAAISCWRCHGKKGMWLPAKNDIMTAAKGRRPLDIFDDTGADKLEAEDRRDRLFGLYTGEIEPALVEARRTHAKATDRVTGNMDVSLVATTTVAAFNQYRFNSVSPATACRELGWDVSKMTEDEQLDFLDWVIPKLLPNRLGIRPESVMVGHLKNATKDSDIQINRDDWEQEYPDVMLRATAAALFRQAADNKKQEK